MLKILKKKLLSLLLIFSIFTVTLSPMPTQGASKKFYSQYVTDVTVTKKGNKVTVKYKVIGNPPGISTVHIGMEDSTGHFKKAELVGKKGKHSKTFTTSGTCCRLYTQLTARDYRAPKDVIKTYYNVSTGTTYHTVTWAEAANETWAPILIGSGLCLVPTIGPTASILLKVGGVSFTIFSGLSIKREQGQYIVTTTSLNKSKGNLTTTVKIYSSKKCYQSKEKPKYSYSGTKHIGF
ncbi:MAG: hypothetical protein HFG29_01095 [Eubacterium sp.]|nr:hypothetical protein [Eubacterium sp.]